MPVLRKQAKITFQSQSGWSAVFHPVYQEHVDASRFSIGSNLKKILETGNAEFEDYLALGMRPIRLASESLIGIYSIDSENENGEIEKTNLESLSKDDAFNFVCQLCGIDKEFHEFCKALGDGQKKTSLDT